MRRSVSGCREVHMGSGGVYVRAVHPCEGAEISKTSLTGWGRKNKLQIWYYDNRGWV